MTDSEEDPTQASPTSKVAGGLGSRITVLAERFWIVSKRTLLQGQIAGAPSRVMSYLWYGLIFLLGAAVWTYILDVGRIPFDLHDWAEGTGHRLAFLQNAVMELRLPLHMPDGSALRNVTDRFISTPDVILSPQVVALRFLTLGQFVLFNTLLLYAVGFIGLLRLARRFHLSPLVFAAIFVLFSLNGHIVDHIVVGHMHWAGYFLLPFFFGSMLDMLDHREIWRWSLDLAVLMFLIFLQGAFHLFIMCLFFLGFLAFSRRELWRYGLAGGAASLLVSAVRILPPALEMGNFDSEFLSGFPSVGHLWHALTDLRVPRPEFVFSRTPLTSLGWWEFDHYIGWPGLVLVLGFGLAAWWRAGGTYRLPRDLAVPALAMFVLSIGQVFEPINRLGIPLISSQRVSARFVIFPLLVLLISAGVHLQAWIREQRSSSRLYLAGLAFFLLAFQDLWQHAKLWRVQRMPELFPSRAVDLSGEFIANHADPAYAAAIALGLILGVMALITLAWQARMTRIDAGTIRMEAPRRQSD